MAEYSIFDNYDVETNNKEENNVGFDFEPIDKYDEYGKEKKEIDIPNEAKQKNNLLKIVPYPTKKSDIKQRPLMKEKIIPRHPSRVIFNGRSGSGKSNLLVNLMSRPEFYGRTDKKNEKSQYFDLVFLFSPTAGTDDLVEFLKIPSKRVFSEFDNGILSKIIETQKNIIETNGLSKSPKILIIFEDIQSDKKFMSSKEFLKSFIMLRHYNASVFLLGQSWTKTPRACRLQATNIFMFPSSNSEVELLAQEFSPPHTSKTQFMELVKYATNEPYQFLHINMDAQVQDRYRKNLDNIIRVKK